MLVVGTLSVWGTETNRPAAVDPLPATVVAGSNSPALPAWRESTTTESAERRRDDSVGQRWERFEAEFGIQRKDDSLAKNTMRTAKYRLDRATFAMQEFVDNVESAMRFDYGWNDRAEGVEVERRARLPARPSDGFMELMTDSLRNARLQSDVELRLDGRAFIGIKLVLPVGD